MDVYSPALLASFIASGTSLALTFAAWRRWVPYSATLAGWAGWASLVLVAVATVSHVVRGHQPGTADGLNLYNFLAIHPAVLVAAVMGLAAALWTRARRGPPRSSGT